MYASTHTCADSNDCTYHSQQLAIAEAAAQSNHGEGAKRASPPTGAYSTVDVSPARETPFDTALYELVEVLRARGESAIELVNF